MKLINGLIPAYSACPFHSECFHQKAGLCPHGGIHHRTQCDCSLARLFDLLEEEEKTK